MNTIAQKQKISHFGYQKISNPYKIE